MHAPGVGTKEVNQVSKSKGHRKIRRKTQKGEGNLMKYGRALQQKREITRTGGQEGNWQGPGCQVLLVVLAGCIAAITMGEKGSRV